jgi:hypothetical protein
MHFITTLLIWLAVFANLLMAVCYFIFAIPATLPDTVLQWLGTSLLQSLGGDSQKAALQGGGSSAMQNMAPKEGSKPALIRGSGKPPANPSGNASNGGGGGGSGGGGSHVGQDGVETDGGPSASNKSAGSNSSAAAKVDSNHGAGGQLGGGGSNGQQATAAHSGSTAHGSGRDSDFGDQGETPTSEQPADSNNAGSASNRQLGMNQRDATLSILDPNRSQKHRKKPQNNHMFSHTLGMYVGSRMKGTGHIEAKQRAKDTFELGITNAIDNAEGRAQKLLNTPNGEKKD